MKQEIENVKPDLEINEHVDSHKQGFKIQKVGIILILAMVLLAALGLFGDGVLSKASSSSPSAKIDYQKFYRFEARMELKIELLQFENSNVVSFTKDYLKEFEIESINPTPESTNFKGNTSQFVFNGPGNGIITFFLIPKKVGSIEGELLVNTDRFRINHFIYP
jgi:hypothetical protein